MWFHGDSAAIPVVQEVNRVTVHGVDLLTFPPAACGTALELAPSKSISAKHSLIPTEPQVVKTVVKTAVVMYLKGQAPVAALVTNTRQQATAITPEAKAAISKELADVRKEKEEILQTLKEQPAVVAAKSADEAAIKAYQDMTKRDDLNKLVYALHTQMQAAKAEK